MDAPEPLNNLHEAETWIKKKERSFYVKTFIAFSIGAALLLSVWSLKGTLASVIGTIGVLIIIGSLIAFGAFIDLFSKIKGRIKAEKEGEAYKETYINWPVWFIKWGRGVLLLILSIGLGVFGAQHENNFGGNNFVWHSFLAGLIIGFFIYRFLKLIKPRWSEKPKMASEIGFYITVTTIYLFVVLGPIVNSKFDTSIPVCNSFVLLETAGNYIIVLNNGKAEKFNPGKNFSGKSAAQKKIVLCIREGFLGYKYVSHFR